MSITKLGRVYKTLLRDYPVAVQIAQTGVLMGSGDLLAQTVVERKTFEQIQFKRTALFFGLGSCLVGPTLTIWYRFLSKSVGDSGKSVVLKKVAMDQLMFAPCFNAIFISVLTTLKGGNLDQVKNELDAKYVDIMISNYKLWPAVQLVNFYLLPLNYQVLFVQIIALAWNTYLSWKTQQTI